MNPPPQHVLDGWQSAEFWANKVLREHRATAPAQVRPCSSPNTCCFWEWSCGGNAQALLLCAWDGPASAHCRLQFGLPHGELPCSL